VSKLHQRCAGGDLLFASDPDRCCDLNKVQPLAKVLTGHDVWISGVRGDQTAQRKAMHTEQPGPEGTLRFHPLLDWTAADVRDYARAHALPAHPLDGQGYVSIGCEPCTRRVTAADGRDGRWFGMQKRECGLHTDLIEPAGEGSAGLKRFARATDVGLS
jgi:phosphoadenosine phosphosulfate reductase